jgi:long-chain acyl-CoA synthetase
MIESIEYILNALKSYKPHYFVSVPRLYEKAYHGILHRIQTGSKLKRLLFSWAARVGRKVSVEYLQKNRTPAGLLAWKYRLAKKLVFQKITALFGGEAELTISGGAPLSREIGQFFAAAGLIIAEGYGLTEMSPVTHANRIDNIKFGTVGPPLPDVKMRIAEDGEILLNGPNRMQGYYNDPAETEAAIDKEGWFHSGDIGYVDEGGYLVITDRKKNLIVTAGGKNIAPAPLEQRLSSSRYIDQCVVIGDRRKYLSALLVLNQEAVEYWAKANGLMNGEYAAFIKSREVNDLISQEVKDLQK